MYANPLTSRDSLENRSPGERSLLCFLSLPHHDRFPKDLLKLHWERTVPAGASNNLGYDDCLEQFRHDGLIELRDERLEDGSIETRILIGETCQNAVHEIYLWSPETLSQIFNDACSLLNSVWPKSVTAEVHFSSLDEVSNWRACRRLFPHVDKLLTAYMDSEGDIRKLCATRDLACLFIEASWYFMPRKSRFYRVLIC